MSGSRPISHGAYAAAGNLETLSATDGEISFLWSFIQGSLMIPETWKALLRGYGFCERHAWLHISVEMSFREEYLLGPTILYGALMEKSAHAVGAPRAIGLPAVIGGLRAAAPCFLCRLSVKDPPRGAFPLARREQGRNSAQLLNFAGRLQPLWGRSLCPECAGQRIEGAAPNRCRRHLLAAAKTGATIDIVEQRTLLQNLRHHLARYQRSFLVGGTSAGEEDRAALIAAIGWCSGWRPLLAQLSRPAPAAPRKP